MSVAGFVQTADQPGGARVRQLAAGADVTLLDWLTASAEGMRRRFQGLSNQPGIRCG